MPKENTPPCARIPSYMTAFQSSPKEAFKNLEIHPAKLAGHDVLSPRRRKFTGQYTKNKIHNEKSTQYNHRNKINPLPRRSHGILYIVKDICPSFQCDALKYGNVNLLGTPDTKRNGRITRNARKALTSTPCINVDREELTAAAPAPAPPPATVPLTVSGMLGVSPPMENRINSKLLTGNSE
ncbi:hypothetical protein GQX74_013219 [Glossina fuscipes]|nr:hypothetical protein GQX74_013219 [Glossina fuscipes]